MQTQPRNKHAAATSTTTGNTMLENGVSLWRQRHKQAFITSAKKFTITPLATFLTIAVIGISLALPTLLLVFLKNVEALSASWGTNTQISFFVKMNQSEQAIQQLINRLQADPAVAVVNYIPPAEGLQRFQKASGISNLQSALSVNPLPPLLEIKPAPQLQTAEAVQQLVTQLQQFPEADMVQLDMQWVERLFAMIHVAKRGVFGLAILLSLGVMLIIGNTIRLATQNNREEMTIMKLIGATNAFVRRPFLYTGIFYGLLGGVFAWVVVEIALWSLETPITHLANAYQTTITLQGLGLSGTLRLFFLASVLGLVSSWFVVGRYLNVTSMRDAE